MDALLYLALFVTSVAMLAILTLVFFEDNLRAVLPGRFYRQTFAWLAVLAFAGILMTSTLGFRSHHPNVQARVVSERGR